MVRITCKSTARCVCADKKTIPGAFARKKVGYCVLFDFPVNAVTRIGRMTGSNCLLVLF
jgi:hypothetical protein